MTRVLYLADIFELSYNRIYRSVFLFDKIPPNIGFPDLVEIGVADSIIETEYFSQIIDFSDLLD